MNISALPKVFFFIFGVSVFDAHQAFSTDQQQARFDQQQGVAESAFFDLRDGRF